MVCGLGFEVHVFLFVLCGTRFVFCGLWFMVCGLLLVVYGLWLVFWCVDCGEHTGDAKPFFSKRKEAAQLHMHLAAYALQEGIKGIGLGGWGVRMTG